MSSDKSINGVPKNDGNSSIISICFNDTCIKVDNVTYISDVEGDIQFSKTEGLLFHLILNADILSIIPREDLQINKKSVTPGNMYILDIKDKIECQGREFYLRESKVQMNTVSSASNEIASDITQEIKISSFSHNSSFKDDELEEVEELKRKQFSLDFLKQKFNFNKKQKIENVKKSNKESIGRNAAISNLDKEGSSLLSHLKSANTLVRVFANLLDIAIAFILLEFIVIDREVLSFFKFESYANLDEFDFVKSFVQQAISVSVVFWGLRIIGSLIFGVSLGQMLLGMSSDGNLLAKRIKSPLREIIGIFTGPFLIFDLPSLIGKRTLKEVLTSSKVVSSGFIKTFILFLCSFILVFVLWITIPILNSPVALKTISVSEAILNPPKKVTVDYFKRSDFFNVSIDSKQEILPFFYYKRVGKSIIGQPELQFYDNKQRSSIKFIKKVDLRQILKKVKENNLNIKNFYPELSMILFDKKIQSLNRPSIKEIMSVTNDSFNLTLDSLVDHVLTRGPFIRPYLNFRLAIESAISSNFTSIHYENIANHPYMVFNKTKNSKRVLGLSLFEANIFDIDSKNKKFNKSLLPQKIVGIKEDSLLDIIDILYQKQFSNLKLSKAFEISFEFLNASLNQEIQISKDKIIASFESQLNYLNLIKKTIKIENTKIFIDKYVQNLSDLLRAYKDEDKVYFNQDNSEDSSIKSESELKENNSDEKIDVIDNSSEVKGDINE